MLKKIEELNDIILDDLLTIWLVTSLDCHRFISEDYWRSGIKRQRVREELMVSDVYVYCVEDKIVGFLALTNAYIPDLYVLKEYQQKGIGTALLNKAKEVSERLILSTYQKNNTAYHYYLKHGFTVIDTNIGTDNNEVELDMEWHRA